MRRRDFITLFCGATAWPIAARAQQPGMPVIGVLNARRQGDDENVLAAFRQGLRETGHIEGQNIAFEHHRADEKYDRLPTLAADLVRRQVTVIAAIGGTTPALAAKNATSKIPIVFYTAGNPVEMGFVASLARPNTNMTGVSTMGSEIGPKRFQLLHELIPTATTIGLLVNPTSPDLTRSNMTDAEAAGRALGLRIQVLHASTEHDFDTVFANLAHQRVDGLVIAPDAFFTGRTQQLAALALTHKVPTVYQFLPFAAAGGLMSYGTSQTEAYRLVGVYTGRILNGEKPADLPVQQATKIELIINLKTAKALGLEVPRTLLARADEVIE